MLTLTVPGVRFQITVLSDKMFYMGPWIMTQFEFVLSFSVHTCPGIGSCWLSLSRLWWSLIKGWQQNSLHWVWHSQKEMPLNGNDTSRRGLSTKCHTLTWLAREEQQSTRLCQVLNCLSERNNTEVSVPYKKGMRSERSSPRSKGEDVFINRRSSEGIMCF